MINNISSIAVHAFARCIPMSLTVNETLLPRYVSFSINSREPLFRVEMSPSWLKHVCSVLSVFTWKPVPPAACSRLCSKYSAWVGVSARILSRLWTNMWLICPLAELQKCQRSLCLYPVSEPWLTCFYRASLSLWQFLSGEHRLEVFAPSSLCVWNQKLWRNLRTRVPPRGFFS